MNFMSFISGRGLFFLFALILIIIYFYNRMRRY